MFTVAAICALSIWIYLLLFRGGFWKMSDALPCAMKTTESAKKVAVIVPARNEADVVGRSVCSLLNQTRVPQIHIFLVDDSSSDGTAEVARACADNAGRSGQLTIIAGRPLPPGWSGKLWAVHQGIEHAGAFQPDFLLLTDADIDHAPGSVVTLLDVAENGPRDLASFMVKLHCETLAERALVPAFVFFFFLLYPPAWISDPRRRTAGAAGGSILIRPAALERAGGIEAIRAEVIDDCALARRVKSSGGSVWLGLATETRSIRPYGNFAEVGKMISRSAFNQLQHSALLLLLALAGLILTYVFPLLLLFSGQPLASLLGAAAYLLMVSCFLPSVRFYGLNWLWAPALPLIALFYMGATFHSAFKYWGGRGGEWKGRIQDPAGNPERM